MKPNVFIASTTESEKIALAIQNNLCHVADPIVWNQGVFDLSSTAMESLLKKVSQSDFAVFIFSSDDKVEIRQQRYNTVRDNIVYELGLFTGRLGRERCFIVRPSNPIDFRLPSDLLGITEGRYDHIKALVDPLQATAPACGKIAYMINQLGLFNIEDSIIETDYFFKKYSSAFSSDDIEGFWLTRFSFTSRKNGEMVEGIQYDFAELKKKGSRFLVGNNFNGKNSLGSDYKHNFKLTILNNYLAGQWFGINTNNIGSLQLFINPRPIIMIGKHIGNVKNNLIQAGTWEWIRIKADDSNQQTEKLMLKSIEEIDEYFYQCLNKEVNVNLNEIICN